MASKWYTINVVRVSFIIVIGFICLGFIPFIFLSEIPSDGDGMTNVSTSIFKETTAMVSASSTQYLQTHKFSSATRFSDLLPYFHYVKLDSKSKIDGIKPNTYMQCSLKTPCILLHSGALLLFNKEESFGGKGKQNFIACYLDTDGSSPDGTLNAHFGNKVSIPILLFYTQRVDIPSRINQPAHSSLKTYKPRQYKDPKWLQL